MMYYLKVGGPLMWILFILSIVSTAIIIERLVYFFRVEKGLSANFENDVVESVTESNIEKAMFLCERQNNTVGRSVHCFLRRCNKNGDFHHFDQLIKEIGIKTIGPLEKRLFILAIIGSVAPMLGLLGTVTGMIQAFRNLATLGAGDPSIVADGISKALITTAGGLTVAIPALVAYNLFNKKIEDIEGELDKITTNIINVLRHN